jgi:hypothetical protein
MKKDVTLHRAIFQSLVVNNSPTQLGLFFLAIINDIDERGITVQSYVDELVFHLTVTDIEILFMRISKTGLLVAIYCGSPHQMASGS